RSSMATPMAIPRRCAPGPPPPARRPRYRAPPRARLAARAPPARAAAQAMPRRS
ncbi:MAG TPA: DUF4115 domain-containing protein, partial [Pseudomonas sp.]|nr:DUF4115 domain-containing protein [Pseudomonas sp.]